MVQDDDQEKPPEDRIWPDPNRNRWPVLKPDEEIVLDENGRPVKRKKRKRDQT